MAATRSFTLLLVALVAAMATAFVPGNVVSRSSGEFLWGEWDAISLMTTFVFFDGRPLTVVLSSEQNNVGGLILT
jgi:hypothetical protein